MTYCIVIKQRAGKASLCGSRLDLMDFCAVGVPLYMIGDNALKGVAVKKNYLKKTTDPKLL